ncbi:hypothetical protein [Amphiplicatus metriothermophilus]|uniref:Uncharacterized protein n=1 Tax=Amphiplicatus metriothermophilus TaxID=1519374 RepID=A0A239PKF7_9PROT|nr:hypothetical protein [Amphiplicatus metriothermophilus]MBB5517626.1 hypothetical protein [Amphiplicatus metriothermophilus]SNT68040.1 hypothetical protein SAMN06297382_0536 [Amphiplicatus metriothermophilus]
MASVLHHLIEDDDPDNHACLHVSADETANREPADLTAEQVRQGHTGDHLRYILAASLAGGAAAVFAVYGLIAG